MKVYDKSISQDIIIYKFDIGYTTYLAEVEISTKKLLKLRYYDKYVSDLPDKILVGEYDYNVAYKTLKQKNIIV